MTETLTGKLLVASSLVDDPLYAGGVCLVVHQDDAHVIGVMLNRPMKPSPKALLAMLGKSLPAGDSDQAEPSVENRFGDQDLGYDSGSSGEADSESEADPGDDATGMKETNEPEANESELGDDDALAGAVSGDPSKSPSSPWRMLHFGGPLSGPVVAIHQFSQYAEAETGSGIYVAAQKQHLEDLMRRQTGRYRLIVGHLGWGPEQLDAEIEAGYWHVVPATVDTVFSAANEMWPRLIRRATSSSLARWIGVQDLVGAGELN